MSSPKRKRTDQETEAEPAFKYFISEEKPIPATNPNHVFQCKTCFKEFKSFQALGGHRASHTYKNPKSVLGSVSKKSHQCGICLENFETGQALGGHTRKHRSSKAGNVTAKTECFKASSPQSVLIHDEISSTDETNNKNSTLVTRNFFPMAAEPQQFKALKVDIMPVLARDSSWLDLTLGLPSRN